MNDFKDVQRIVLRGSVWKLARHLVLSFPKQPSPLNFLHRLKSSGLWPTAVGMPKKPDVQVSLGFSRRGLEHVLVPPNVLAAFAMKAPAFSAGAAMRASSRLRASGGNVPGFWDEAFGFMTLDAVLSLHAMNARHLARAIMQVKKIARGTEVGVRIRELPLARRLPPPWSVEGGKGEDPRAQWTHFGYRDGLARVGIEDPTRPEKLDQYDASSRYPAGEFLLGHAQKSGANPWIAGPGRRVWPEELRKFFRDGSFGVLHQIEQDVQAFERFIADKTEPRAEAEFLTPVELKAKLCGRYPDGLPLAAEKGADAGADFNYTHDCKGYCCPFGSHVRRMNPRGGALAHGGRARPLLRRGMPYGTTRDGVEPDTVERGLIGHFFCASIEDQFEHLIGQWAERVPLGSEDRGRARDPLIGAHEPGDGAFEIPRPGPQSSLMLTGLRPFTRTRGIAYLFYPSLPALDGIARNSLWGALSEDDA